MFFASPIWLALLLPPWAAVAAWLMWSRRGARTDVPFLALWRDETAESPREKRHFRPPPLALVAALLAVLLAIVASARPGVYVPSGGAGPVVAIVVDRGVTMSSGDRLAEVIDAARPAVLETLGDGPTDLVLVPDGTPQRVSRSAWADAALKATPTQGQTADAVQRAVNRALAATPSGPVIVLSDQAVAANPRVVQIAPAKPLANVAITQFVVRESPRPQAMLAVANSSPLERATVRVRSSERTVAERAVELAQSPGGETKVFIDLPPLDAAAVAELDVADDIAIDNVAHAKRARSFPNVEIRAAVPAEVRRVAEAYAKTRPANAGSRRVAVAADDAVPSDVPIAIVARPVTTSAAGPVTVAAHPVSAGVDWADATAQASGAPPGGGWRSVVSVGGRPAVAVRETPHRQVWIGLDAPDFARTPAFVIFWTNVFDWLAGDDGGGGGGGGGVEGQTHVADAARHWASTVVPPVRISPPPADDWRAKLAALKPPRRGRADVTSAVLLGCVMCLILAALAWPGRRLTAFSAPRTV